MKLLAALLIFIAVLVFAFQLKKEHDCSASGGIYARTFFSSYQCLMVKRVQP